MKRYNKEQVKAIKSINKNILLIAGAGTGKTTVLIERIKYLLKKGVDSSEILAITFTKKASEEMKSRLGNKQVDVFTFDAFCYNFIKKDFNIKILEDDTFFDKKEMLSFHLYDANYKKGKKPKKYDEYVKYKIDNGLYDFNDLEYLTINKLKMVSLNYKYILIDEFQDTNLLQFNLLKMMSTTANIFAVGDPDQSIYSFRGTYSNILEKYIESFNAKVKYLTLNYRSNSNIIDLANKVIHKNKGKFKKKLIANKKEKGLIELKKYKNEQEEIIRVINTYESIKAEDVAIIYRNNHQGQPYKNYFRNKYKKPSILTIHEAKGLEFDTVFLIGVDKNIFPNNKSNKESQLEEERRLLFVAITRAKENLFISYSKKSRFIREIKFKSK